eukprot:TRINITY_DN5592_c0_g1_i3.p1 TRINITY_DN5592_c0_g1~~TRINITY_DN5592_c0_g1_i3.p1  ORF type:complete len:136 (-),score=60.57 TRINITY_DN5592_c0_g1_i3:23-430(-)
MKGGKKGKKLILNEEVEQSFFKKIMGAAKGMAGKALKSHPIAGKVSGVLNAAKSMKGGKKGKKLILNEEVEQSFFKKIMGAAAAKSMKGGKKGKKLILNEEVEQSFFKKIMGAAKGMAGKAAAKSMKGGKKGKKL